MYMQFMNLFYLPGYPRVIGELAISNLPSGYLVIGELATYRYLYLYIIHEPQEAKRRRDYPADIFHPIAT